MLRAEDNRLLTESGEDTPMGALLRRFWLPVLLSEELPEADGPPKMIMGLEPLHEKWASFGWDTQRIDGNDISAIVAAIANAKKVKNKPHAIVLDTLMTTNNIGISASKLV